MTPIWTTTAKAEEEEKEVKEEKEELDTMKDYENKKKNKTMPAIIHESQWIKVRTVYKHWLTFRMNVSQCKKKKNKKK